MRKADWLIGFLIAAVVLGVIYYFSRSIQTINNQDPDRPSVAETLNQIGDGKDATLEAEDAYDEGDGKFPDDITTGTTGSTADAPTAADIAALNAAKEAEVQAAADAAAKNAAATDAAAANAAKNQPTAYSNGSSESGDYLVVAGTFKQMINAETALRTYKSKGYSNAYIGKFNKSAYASLIVGRFARDSEARNFAKSFNKKNNTDAYVHQKR